MKYFIGNTDHDWYHYLKSINPEDINFWQPGGSIHFKAIDPGSPFLLKLKHPINKIAGIGFFISHSILPIDLAWEIFQNRNGVDLFSTFYTKINSYRNHSNPLSSNPNIGCIVLTNPIFFDENDWISLPLDWAKNIVQGKTYDTESDIGLNYWSKVESMLFKYLSPNKEEISNSLSPNFKKYLTKVRIGQGAFRVSVTEAYLRRCAISGEKTLPVLEAAHIKPYMDSGINTTNNGLLLRSDLHKLFDMGYLTITDQLEIEVSHRIKEEFENGRDYYKFHGKHLTTIPKNIIDQPDKDLLIWHNENIYKG